MLTSPHPPWACLLSYGVESNASRCDVSATALVHADEMTDTKPETDLEPNDEACRAPASEKSIREQVGYMIYRFDAVMPERRTRADYLRLADLVLAKAAEGRG